MNKTLFSLAFISFAFLAISACSEDTKEKSHSELCASGPSKDCLVGKWALEADPLSNCNEPGMLEFQANDDFYFQGTIAGMVQDDYYGTWALEGSALTATNLKYTSPTTGTVTISNEGRKMVVKSTGSVSTFVQCSPELKEYNFTWKGE